MSLGLLGYLDFDHRLLDGVSFGLYLSENDGRIANTANAVALDIDLKDNDERIGRYVVVEGIYRARIS